MGVLDDALGAIDEKPDEKDGKEENQETENKRMFSYGDQFMDTYGKKKETDD